MNPFIPLPALSLPDPLMVHGLLETDLQQHVLAELNAWLLPQVAKRVGSELNHPLYWHSPKRPTPGVEMLHWSLHFHVLVGGRKRHGELRSYEAMQTANLKKSIVDPKLYRLVVPPEVRVV